MFSIPEQLSLASKAMVEAHLVSANAFAQAAFESGNTLVELNVGAFKKTLAALTAAGEQLLTVRDTQQFSSLATQHSQQAMERIRDYGRQAADLVQDSRSKFSRVAESEGAASRQKVVELVEAVKKAPAAAAAPLNTFFKTAFPAAHEGYDRFVQAGESTLAKGAKAQREELSAS
ncbi:MAG TPA: phasin family protein [Janthinobacterium sp.]|jgi:phasin family protein|nr:phasin family protein [Janthinobacterium sp.]